METFFAPTPDQTTDILAPMNPVLRTASVRNDWLTPTVGIGSTRNQPAFGMLNSGIQDALAVLSFVSPMLRG